MTPNDVKIVADNIDDFIEVPDGVSRLRKAVLTLAVAGKLVTQDKSEGTAESLYLKVRTERLSRQKKAKDFTSVGKEEAPFEIPASWKWVRIREITHDSGQKTPDKDFCYVDVSSIDSSLGLIVEPKYLKASEAPSRARKCVEDKSVIYSGVRPYLLNTAIVDLSKIEKEVIVSTAFFVLKPFTDISSEYIHLLVRSPYFDELANKACVGVAYPAINDDKFEKLPVPLPPLAEQKRIVKKVEEVMKQLDDLETKKRNCDEARTRLARSAMQSLGKGESKVAFEQLTELIKTPADIKELEGALLTLAVSGKLVPQDKKDGTAEELYEIILSERAEKGDGGKKNTKKFAPVPLEEIPFGVPTSWKWVPLGSLFLDYGSGSTPSRGSDKYYLENGFNWYKSGELNDSILPIEAQEKVTELALKECRLRIFKPGDFLIAMYGATAGRIAVSQSIGTTNQAVWSGTPVRAIDDRYLYYYVLQSRQILINKSSGAAQPNISGEKIIAHPFALPPLTEQKRIVKKVEEVMDLVNQLRDILGESKASGRGRPKK